MLKNKSMTDILKNTESGKNDITSANDVKTANQKGKSVITYKRDKRLIPVKDLFKEVAEEQSFLWGSFIPTGSIAMLCGPSDGGKTMLARQLCIALARGDKELLSFNLNPKYKRSLYVSTEDSKNDWVVKMKKIGLNENEIELVGENMLLVTEYDELLKLLENELMHNPVDLVVLDVLSDVFTGDLNSTQLIRGFLKHYKQLAEKFGTSFLFIHHLSKKGESSGSPNKQNVLGAMGIESSMRSVIELRKDPADANIKLITITKGNYVSEAVKKKVYKIKHGANFLYESVGLDYSDIEKEKNNVNNEVIKLKEDGLTYREIATELEKNGTKIGKSKVGKIINQKKAEQDSILESEQNLDSIKC
jgi:RecA-family ATPase